MTADPHTDQELADQIKDHHAVMIRDLDRLATAMERAATTDGDFATARHDLQKWVADVLEPHADDEEESTYRAAAHLERGEALIASMMVEHGLIRGTAKRVFAAEDPRSAAAFARSLYDIFHAHQASEDDIIVPMLLAAEGVSLREILGGSGHSHLHGDGHDHGAHDGHHH